MFNEQCNIRSHEVSTVAILAQGTIWAVAASQAFLDHCRPFSGGRGLGVVHRFRVRLFPVKEELM